MEGILKGARVRPGGRGEREWGVTKLESREYACKRLHECTKYNLGILGFWVMSRAFGEQRQRSC